MQARFALRRAVTEHSEYMQETMRLVGSDWSHHRPAHAKISVAGQPCLE